MPFFYCAAMEHMDPQMQHATKRFPPGKSVCIAKTCYLVCHLDVNDIEWDNSECCTFVCYFFLKFHLKFTWVGLQNVRARMSGYSGSQLLRALMLGTCHLGLGERSFLLCAHRSHTETPRPEPHNDMRKSHPWCSWKQCVLMFHHLSFHVVSGRPRLRQVVRSAACKQWNTAFTSKSWTFTTYMMLPKLRHARVPADYRPIASIRFFFLTPFCRDTVSESCFTGQLF